MTPGNGFPKIERLKSKKDIDDLFKVGRKIKGFPLMAVYTYKSEHTGVDISFGVSVPKRNIKKAVDRNLIKRRLRESYRLSNREVKSVLKTNGKEINLMLIYTANQILPYKEVDEKIKVILKRLNTEIEKVDS